MTDYLLIIVYIVFISQVAVISFWISNTWRKNLMGIYKNYPQSEYPKFYSQPVEIRYRQLLIRKYLDLAIGGSCFGLIILPDGRTAEW